MVVSVRVTMVKQNAISFNSSYYWFEITVIWILFWEVSLWFVTNNHRELQRSPIVTLMWSSFGDSISNSPWPVPFENCLLKWYHNKVTWWLSGDRHLEKLPWIPSTLHCNKALLRSVGDSSKCNYRDDFIIFSPNVFKCFINKVTTLKSYLVTSTKQQSR